MPHHTSLIETIVLGLALAFALGALANRLRLSPLVGYLAAGIAIGPFTPGFVGDQAMANQLAEIGVILLMFGVGLHFSPADLMAVRRVAIPGAVIQIGAVSAMGMGLAHAMGWPLGGGIVLGLCLSVASTVVVLRVLQERRLMDTERGRIAVGWLVVEDLLTVLALVMLPAVAGLLGGTPQGAATGIVAAVPWLEGPWAAIGLTLVKVAAFVALMMLVGTKVIPRLLHYAAHTGSRELFRLSVLTVALGVAYGSSELFGVSFALGAFFAGMVLAETPLSQRAAQETLPLRDAFAVLFFVSVGMLFDPSVLASRPLQVLAALGVVMAGNAVVAASVILAFRHPLREALTLAFGMAQIGEFSFILAGLGITLGLMPPEGRDLVLAAAMLSILLNPLLFLALDRLSPWLSARERAEEARPAAANGPVAAPAAAPDLPVTGLAGHVIVVGYGRVGARVARELDAAGTPFLVIEENETKVDVLRAHGVEAIGGNAAQEGVLERANVAGAARMVCAIPDAYEAGNVVEGARTANPGIAIAARASDEAGATHLLAHGADTVVTGHEEVARALSEAVSALPPPADMPASTPAAAA